MNFMGDHDIHQAFNRALPSQAWCLQQLLVALVDVRDWKSCLPGASMLLDPAENLRMQRKRNQGDREVLTLAYAMHHLLLGKVLGMDPALVPSWRDAAGCPRVGDDLVHTSLSHAGDWITLVVSRVGPVGVDIEPLARMGVLVEMANGICHFSELAELEIVAAEQRGRALLVLWVRNEALLKAAGTGLSLEMSSFAALEGQVRPMPILEGTHGWRCLNPAPPAWLRWPGQQASWLPSRRFPPLRHNPTTCVMRARTRVRIRDRQPRGVAGSCTAPRWNWK